MNDNGIRLNSKDMAKFGLVDVMSVVKYNSATSNWNELKTYALVLNIESPKNSRSNFLVVIRQAS